MSCIALRIGHKSYDAVIHKCRCKASSSGHVFTILKSCVTNSRPILGQQLKFNQRVIASASFATSVEATASTLYELLGVESSCTAADIRKAYRRSASTCHPDVSNGESAQARFQAITLAYEVLKDEELRSKYDAHGILGLGPKYTILRQYLSNHKTADSSAKEKGSDAYAIVGLDFTESVTGVERVIEVSVQGTCSGCQGTGRAVQVGSDGSCHACRGSGEALHNVWQPSGIKITKIGVCPVCGGTGIASTNLCAKCAGDGRAPVHRRVSVKIPGGVTSDSVLRVRGFGNAGKWGGKPGDLLLKFRVHDEPEIERKGNHLYSTITCDIWQVLVGASIPVRSVRGERLLTIPPGSQHGDVIELSHAGVPSASGRGGIIEYGHHYFQLKVILPHGGLMSAEMHDLLKQLNEQHIAHGSLNERTADIAARRKGMQ